MTEPLLTDRQHVDGIDCVSKGRTRRAVKALADGKPVVLVDRRMRRGELLVSAELATTAAIAFAVRHTSGFLRVILPAQRCRDLGLVAQCGADDEHAGTHTGQRVSVDAALGIGTGISATDRARTIRVLASPNSTPDSLTRPGHVVTQRVALHRPLADYGYDEAALQLALSADLQPSVVLATIVGTGASVDLCSGDELLTFANELRLPLVSVDDVITHAKYI
ncbi:3,4-dihydroxy-2-butanone-4-phosphate synthase [Rhodococcus sp. T2V]|uniref:3,4-dihydroxy-2-butanone-4-phosphate synthase n=1 Tax=Rhodococcus sp. T2V TaxID=3034164 RepID=UPI0023E1AA97|nr:3,4-dihydroxy-2-butanone-4-phosphate synthase [Rhodococcus sp. T2V]MDF3309580.1 3,4-dihydroxy-2-butanone-4-phosphate synthase [Rhodococcus sp. T2V]